MIILKLFISFLTVDGAAGLGHGYFINLIYKNTLKSFENVIANLKVLYNM